MLLERVTGGRSARDAPRRETGRRWRSPRSWGSNCAAIGWQQAWRRRSWLSAPASAHARSATWSGGHPDAPQGYPPPARGGLGVRGRGPRRLRRPGGAVDAAVAPATAAPALLPPAPAYTPAPGGAALPVGMLTFARNDRPLVKRCSACIAIQPVGGRCSSYSDEHLPLQSLLASDRQKG